MQKTGAQKYIRIEETGRSATGKTRVWRVFNFHHGENCGQIRWHGGWWKYCFYPTDGFLFDASCLRLVAEFLEQQTGEHMAGRRRNEPWRS